MNTWADFWHISKITASRPLALGSLSTLLFTDISLLIDPLGTESGAAHGDVLYGISIFRLLSDNILLAKWICVVLLCCVVSGYYPRVTCFFHWWTSASMVASFRLFDGGDFITQVMTLLLIPICLQDGRANHWKGLDPRGGESQVFAGVAYTTSPPRGRWRR